MTARRIGTTAFHSLLGEWRAGGLANEELSDRIRLLILDGRLPVGTRLPAERDLATRLRVSRTTVAAAYRRLRDAGFVSSVQGSGSVTRMPAATPARAIPGVPTTTAAIDLTKAAMPAAPQVMDAVRRAAERLPAFLADWDYDPVGLPPLRQAIADRYTARGLPTSPDQIMVTIGAQHAIALLARLLVTRGDRVVIDSPTYPHAQEALRQAGARLVPVSVTADEGWDADALEQAIDRTSPSLLYVMPDFHNPTGATMSATTRERMLQAAARQGATVLVDETTAELAIDEAAAAHLHPPVGAGETGARVITVGSVGKTVWGGLRIGWVRAEPSFIERLVLARSAMDLGTPVLDQLVVLELLPQLDDIIAGRMRQLADSRARVEALIAERFPHWQVPHVSGGLAVWVGLGEPVSSALALAARAHGLVITAGPRFGLDGTFERFLRIPITYSPETLEAAIDRLQLAWFAIGGGAFSREGLAATFV